MSIPTFFRFLGFFGSIHAITGAFISSLINCCSVHQRVGGLQDIRLHLLMVRILLSR
jgi:hypothetical protein